MLSGEAAKPGEPAWESPYGMGRPGWHIECSAMSQYPPGQTIDLHCGGQDLIFPTMKIEIAQSEVRQRLHLCPLLDAQRLLSMWDNQKMSKSLHNFFTVRDVAEHYGYEADPLLYADRRVPDAAELHGGADRELQRTAWSASTPAGRTWTLP